MGSRETLATFLKDFGPTLLKKYNPKAIAVFSANRETEEKNFRYVIAFIQDHFAKLNIFINNGLWRCQPCILRILRFLTCVLPTQVQSSRRQSGGHLRRRSSQAGMCSYSLYVHASDYFSLLITKAGISAQLTTTLEPRRRDGHGRAVAGFHHGVFVPFRVMLGEEFREIPIVQVSIDGSLKPEKNWELCEAVSKLR